MLLVPKLDNFSYCAKEAMLIFALYGSFHATLIKPRLVSGALSNGLAHVLRRSIQDYLSKYKVAQRATVFKSALVQQIK